MITADIVTEKACKEQLFLEDDRRMTVKEGKTGKTGR